jgi:hypothetical protein
VISKFVSSLSTEKKPFFFFFFNQPLTRHLARQAEKVLAGDTTPKSNELIETGVKSSHCEVLLTSPLALPFVPAYILVCKKPSKGRLLIRGYIVDGYVQLLFCSMPLLSSLYYVK